MCAAAARSAALRVGGSTTPSTGVVSLPPHDSTGLAWHHAEGPKYEIVIRRSAVALVDILRSARYGIP